MPLPKRFISRYRRVPTSSGPHDASAPRPAFAQTFHQETPRRLAFFAALPAAVFPKAILAQFRGHLLSLLPRCGTIFLCMNSLYVHLVFVTKYRKTIQDAITRLKIIFTDNVRYFSHIW